MQAICKTNILFAFKSKQEAKHKQKSHEDQKQSTDQHIQKSNYIKTSVPLCHRGP